MLHKLQPLHFVLAKIVMNDPVKYENGKVVVDTANLVFVPKLIKFMDWEFTNGNILDYGCGTGSTGFKLILPQVELTDSQMYSVDISPKMVDFAKKTYPHSWIEYATGSLPNDFPFENLTFDKIFAVHVFHFLPQVQQMLSKMYKLLKPGGELGFTCTTLNFAPIKIWKHLAESEMWGSYMQDYSKFWPKWTDYGKEDPETYFRKVFLNGTGFQEKFFEYTIFKATKPADAVLDVFVSLNPCLDKIPLELRPQLKQDYRKLHAEICAVPENSPTITVELEYICAVLRKPDNYFVEALDSQKRNFGS